MENSHHYSSYNNLLASFPSSTVAARRREGAAIPSFVRCPPWGPEGGELSPWPRRLYSNGRTRGAGIFLSLVFSYVVVLIPRRQANVVIDQEGRARLTDYGLAPINSNPKFAVKISRWPAPEIIDPSHDDDGMPVTESKPADVFAFAMFAVEVFTGKAPFHGLQPVMVAEAIRRGERPRVPRNAQEAGLTSEIWKLLESCWQQDPKKRPMMGEVVRRWEAFHDNTTTKCVQILVIPASSPQPPRSN